MKCPKCGNIKIERFLKPVGTALESFFECDVCGCEWS